MRWTRALVKARRPRGEMNKTERQYESHLQSLLLGARIAGYSAQSVTLKLGPDCRYTPDFLVQLPDGTLELHEVKGTTRVKLKSGGTKTKAYARDDALVKIRAASQQFPVFGFRIAYMVGGQWVTEEVQS